MCENSRIFPLPKMDEKVELSSKLLCNACLCIGRKLGDINDAKIKQYYMDALNELPLFLMPAMSISICWECEALLKKAVAFREQVKDSYRILMTYTTENLHECLLTDVTRAPRLRVATTSPVTIPPDHLGDDPHNKTTLKLYLDETNDTQVNKAEPHNLQQVYVKEELAVSWVGKGESDYSDTQAEDCLGPSEPDAVAIEAEINSILQKGKKNKRRIEKKAKKNKKLKKDGAKLKRQKVSDAEILTIELTYDELMAEREAELMKESYLKAEYKCQDCILGFNYLKSYTTHMNAKHSPSIGECTCPICKTVSASVDSFTAHYKRHLRRYECKLCQKRTMDIKAMQQHYYSSHQITLKEYRCDDCGLVSNSIDSHRYHKDSHKARLQCPECDKTFRHRAGLMNHRLAFHEFQNVFPCTLCDKVFRWKSSLKRHFDRHENRSGTYTSPAFCAECNINFSSIACYQKHLSHSLKHITKEHYKYSCDHCKRRFSDKTKLRYHIEEKHLHKKFHCHICFKPSKNRVSLSQHVRNVHRGRPNNKMCHHCGKGFPTKVQLESHMRTHTGERPFICEYCPTTFSQQSNLYKHNRQVHLNMKSKRYPAYKKKKEAAQAPLSAAEPAAVPADYLHYSPQRFII